MGKECDYQWALWLCASKCLSNMSYIAIIVSISIRRASYLSFCLCVCSYVREDLQDGESDHCRIWLAHAEFVVES